VVSHSLHEFSHILGGNTARGLQMPDPKRGRGQNFGLLNANSTAIISKVVSISIAYQLLLKIAQRELSKDVKLGVFAPQG